MDKILNLVVCLFMVLLVPLCLKSLWAGRAHMRLLSSMSLHMNFQMAFPEKSFVTDATFDRNSFQVNKCFMCQKITSVPCFMWTIVTTEEQTLMSNSFVSCQGPCLSELFPHSSHLWMIPSWAVSLCLSKLWIILAEYLHWSHSKTFSPWNALLWIHRVALLFSVESHFSQW